MIPTNEQLGICVIIGILFIISGFILLKIFKIHDKIVEELHQECK